ncbi:MAG: uroporphyrinogen decarboxylase family protein [Candidatus Zixiibacteriota bacterium]
MNHTDRLQAILEGHRPDRPPVSMWRHFYSEETEPVRFAEAMIGWQRRFDWDFLKINPKASYHYEPWGVGMTFSPDGSIKPKRTEFPITRPEDWLRIQQLPVTHPEFDAQLRAISLIRKALPKPFRVVMTVFNPISIAGDMVESEKTLLDHLHREPETVESALAAIQRTFIDLVTEFRNAGADGIFFATTQWASADTLTIPELKRFALPYDKPLWDAAGPDAFNILHICGSNNYLREYRDFRPAIVNWDTSDPTNPTLADGYAAMVMPVMGGLGHETDMVKDTAAILADKVRRLIDSHNRLPLAVGAGCAVPVTVPDLNYRAVREAVGR